jgi:hypothetical protein
MAEEPTPPNTFFIETSKFNFRPDEHPDQTFHAVGVALTQWERMEQVFAGLYSLFVGSPGDLAPMMAYAREARIFSARMRDIKRSSEKFFAKHPDQKHEGQLEAFIARAVTLSSERHKIAHGVVEPKYREWTAAKGSESKYFRIVPPHYASESLSKSTIRFELGSQDIFELAQKFDELRADLTNFKSELLPLHKKSVRQSREQAKAQ